MKTLFCILVVISVTGCASAVKRHDSLRAELASPIDCQMPEVEVQALLKHKANTSEKLANGFASLWPTAALYNLITGEYCSRVEIATGQLNRSMYAGIDEVIANCHEIQLASISEKESLSASSETIPVHEPNNE